MQPLAEDLVRGELREVRFEGSVMFARSADEKAIPRVFAFCDGEVETVVEIGGVEAE